MTDSMWLVDLNDKAPANVRPMYDLAFQVLLATNADAEMSSAWTLISFHFVKR